MNALEALAISRKYTDEMVEGAGAIKGKNCTISDISPVEGGNNITFSWYLDDGTEQTETLFVANGEDGYDGQDGQDGVTPSILATATVDNNAGTPNVEVVKTGTDANPSFAFNFHNIRGEVGPQGIAGEDGSIWWNTTAAYTEPNYAFNISDLTGPSTKDIALYDYILQTRNNHTIVYVITAINDTTVNTIRFCELTGATGQDGVSPTVTTSEITGGHRITITDAEHPSGQSIDLFNGEDGQDGQDGEDGLPGKNGNIFWITTSDYSTPNYTFDISDLSGVSGMEPSPDDIIIQNVEHRTFLFVIDDVNVDNVRADYFCEITGATGNTGATGTGISSVVLNQDYTLTINYTDGTSTTTASVRGPKGEKGTDGISPTVTVTDYTGYHHVEIVSAGGTESFDIYDGTNGQAGNDGVSPTVTVSTITGGHRVNITDATHPSGQNFDVMDGATGQQGQQGPTGPAGPGVPTGGTNLQVLAKASGTDYDTQWVDGIPAISSSDEGKVLGAGYDDKSGSYTEWVDGIPAISSSDDGKILAAGYDDKSGSYTQWVDAPSGGDSEPTYNLGKYIPILNKVSGNRSWSGLTYFDGRNVWTDGKDIYYSNGSEQYKLTGNRVWTAQSWNNFTNIIGIDVWTDGENIYYGKGFNDTSMQGVNYKLVSTSWVQANMSGMGDYDFAARYIWTDGDNIYYSHNSYQYVLDKSTLTWSSKTWSGLSSFDGRYIWTDGDNIYYNNYNNRYVLDKDTSTWSRKIWSGSTIFSGECIWTDGVNIYYSDGSSDQYVLDKDTSTWSTKTWSGSTDFSGQYIWTDFINNVINMNDANESHNYQFITKIANKGVSGKPSIS